MEETQTQEEAEATAARLIEKFSEESVQITMKIGQVIDIIECGVVANDATGYKPAIIDELVELLGKLFGELDGATDEV